MSALWDAFVSFLTKKPSVPSVIVADIQAATVTLCGFLPMAESVVPLVISLNPNITTASVAAVDGVAKAICSVVSKPSENSMMVSAAWSEPVRTSFIVNGVPVQGRWVR